MQKNLEKYKNQIFNVSPVDLSHKYLENKYSFTFACGIELNYESNNGFNLKVLKLDELKKPKKSYELAIFKKGSNINIYC